MKQAQRFFIIVFCSVALCLTIQRCNAQDGGMYLPKVTNGFNANIFSADSAHFMRVGNQCYVYGLFQIRGTDSVGQVMVHVSTPFPLSYNARRTNAGNNFTFANGYPTVTGWNASTFTGTIQLYYTANQTGYQVVNYFFTFTTK